jgi:predicted ABC-type ATPase
VGIDRVSDIGDDDRQANDRSQDERLQQYVESVRSDTEPKNSPTRQEHADDIPIPDERASSRSNSVDQRDAADQANPTDQQEAPPPTEGDSSETGDSPPHGGARVDTPEDSERQEEPSGGPEIKPDTATEHWNRSTDDSSEDQPNCQPTQKSDEALDGGVPADDSNMSTTITADGEAPRPDDGKPIDDQTHALTDREWAEHITEVRDGLREAYEQKLNTDYAYTINGAGEVWLEGRDRLHDSIIEDLYAKAAEVPCDFKAIVAGGLGGAGKTTVLTQHANIDLSQYLMINPDEIKEEMARRGIIPEIDGLSPMESSDLAHEESSYLAKRLAHRAQADGKNLIWDITMSSEKTTARRIDDLRKAGYTQVDGIFVEISIETSIMRIESRHREGHEKWRTGKGRGGRYVPPEISDSQADSQWGSQNRKTYETMKNRLDNWSTYNNSVDYRPAELIESSQGRHAQQSNYPEGFG